jgi:hypothetical protein
MSIRRGRKKLAAARYVTPQEYASELVKNRRKKNRDNQQRTKERNGTLRRYMEDGIGSSAAPRIKESLNQIPELKDKLAAKRQIVYLICETRAFISSQFPDFYRSEEKHLEDKLSSAAQECDAALALCWESLVRVEALLHHEAVPLRERYAQYLRSQDQKIRLLNSDCVGIKSKVDPRQQTTTEFCSHMLNNLMCAFPKRYRRRKGGQMQPLKHALSTHLAAIFENHGIPLKQPTRSPRKKTIARRVSDIVEKALRFKTFDLAELERRSTK